MYNSLAHTLNTKYELVNIETDDCNGSCTTTPGYTLWKKYRREVSTVNEDVITSSTTGVSVKCSNYEQKTLKVFNVFKDIAGYEKIRVEETVYTYRIKYRSLLNAAYTDIKWSSYNDKTLLDAGYKMTGNKRLVS